jgi:threonine/homoserine/homoserine lactone efflux protein
VLGLLFDVVGTIWNCGVAWFAGYLAASQVYAGVKVWLERTVGALFILVGIRLAYAER